LVIKLSEQKMHGETIKVNEIMFTDVTHALPFKHRITSVIFIAFLV